MDGRGYGSGFSSWGGGGSSSRGSGSYDPYGYKDSGYGGGPMKRGLLSSSGGNADDVIAKINQRLDMLTQLEGGMKGGGRTDRFDQYESFDSRPPALPPRDLYRSGKIVFGERGGMGFGARDAFSGSGWGAGQRSQYRGGGPGGFGHMMGGGGRSFGQGHSPSGRGKLPSLLSHRMYPESGGFQPHHGSQDYPVWHYGGGKNLNRQRNRKRPLNRQQVKPPRDGQKKRKQTPTTADEPESKVGKTESEGNDEAETEKPDEMTEENEKSDDATPVTQESELAAEGESAEGEKGESSQSVSKQQGKPQIPPSAAKLRKRRGFFESRAISRVTYACSLCKFRSFYSEDLSDHLESKFHKEHFRFLSSQLSKPTTEFLQEYIKDKHKKTDLRVSLLDDHSGTICQVLREQDLTRDLGMEHFIRKVEAAYCAACDIYIPMQLSFIQKHLKCNEHNYNRKAMMEQSKRASLSVARSILNHKVIGKKLESYLKGENPFTGSQDDQDPEDSVMEVSEADVEGKQEEGKQEEGKQEEGKQEEGKQEEGKQEEGKQEEGKQEEGKQEEGKQEGAELTEVVGAPDEVGRSDGPEEEQKMEQGRGKGDEGEGGGGVEDLGEGAGVEEEGEGEGQVEADEEEFVEEEEDGVEVKEDDEPDGGDDPEGAADAEAILQGADDDCGIPVIED